VATINPPPAAPAVEAPKKTPVPPVAKAKSNDAFQPTNPGTTTVATAPPTTATAPPKTGGNGYVAVLSSQGSRMDALKVYADLQQKYGDVLANKPADVQEAVVNGKTWFRAVVGPPGSRQAANDICAQIKAAGHKDCFASAY
jgi:septal ring-binding cell division protein DamX